MKNVITGSLKINVAGLQSDKDGKSSVVHVSWQISSSPPPPTGGAIEFFLEISSKISWRTHQDQEFCFTIHELVIKHTPDRDMSWTSRTSRTPPKTSLSK